VVFAGTPEFAAVCLERLIEEEAIELVAVITQPDRPSGRRRKILPSPVKLLALQHNIRLYQPEWVGEEKFLRELEKLCPDYIVVVCFGQIFNKAFIELPKLACINLHASLLPKYRGAAPIEWAIINGETRTGLTTMLVREKVDAGEILLQREIKISPDDTARTLREKMAPIGAELLVETLYRFSKGEIEPREQDEAIASYAPKIRRSHCKIDWSKSAESIRNLIRGLNPKPGAFTYMDINGEKFLVKVWWAKVKKVSENVAPGEIVGIEGDGLIVGTGKGLLKITQLQRENRSKVTGREFACGLRIRQGARFSS